MTTVLVCAGGPRDEVMDLSQFQYEEMVFIGADQGALHLLRENIIPLEAVGDFDSISAEEYREVQMSVSRVDAYQAEKNETDTELAIERALAYQPNKIILTGVTGGRLDHMLSALQLLYRYQKKYPEKSFEIQNKTNLLRFFHPGKHMIVENEQLQYVSFFAFQESISSLTLKGFKYDIDNESLESGMTKFTSNELLGKEGTISFRSGICLMVRSSDA